MQLTVVAGELLHLRIIVIDYDMVITLYNEGLTQCLLLKRNFIKQVGVALHTS